MKTFRLLGIAICTGKKAELDKLEDLAAGTHHVHRNQKGGPRKAKPPGVAEAVELQRAAGAAFGGVAGHPEEGGSHVSD